MVGFLKESLLTMNSKITKEDVELILEMIDEVFFEETHYMEEMLGERQKIEKLQHLIFSLQSDFPDLINEESVFYRTIFE